MLLRSCALAVCLVLVLLPGPASGGRPLDTEDTGTVEPGHVEVAVSADLVRSADQRTGVTLVSVTVGLRQGLDARVEASAFLTDGGGGASGFAEAALGLKYRLLDQTTHWPAVLTALVLRGRPEATQRKLEGIDAVEDGLEIEARLVLSKGLGPVTVTWNGGYGYATDARTVHTMLLGLSAEYRASAAWSLAAETFSEITFDGEGPSVVVRAGAVYSLSERVRMDGAVGVGLTPDSPDVRATLGVTFRF
jgi:hypothetical protein